MQTADCHIINHVTIIYHHNLIANHKQVTKVLFSVLCGVTGVLRLG